jgi:hypothetical protein
MVVAYNLEFTLCQYPILQWAILIDLIEWPIDRHRRGDYHRWRIISLLHRDIELERKEQKKGAEKEQ